jgi:hypothetical protein
MKKLKGLHGSSADETHASYAVIHTYIYIYIYTRCGQLHLYIFCLHCILCTMLVLQIEAPKNIWWLQNISLY